MQLNTIHPTIPRHPRSFWTPRQRGVQELGGQTHSPLPVLQKERQLTGDYPGRLAKPCQDYLLFGAVHQNQKQTKVKPSIPEADTRSRPLRPSAAPPLAFRTAAEGPARTPGPDPDLGAAPRCAGSLHARRRDPPPPSPPPPTPTLSQPSSPGPAPRRPAACPQRGKRHGTHSQPRAYLRSSSAPAAGHLQKRSLSVPPPQRAAVPPRRAAPRAAIGGRSGAGRGFGGGQGFSGTAWLGPEPGRSAARRGELPPPGLVGSTGCALGCGVRPRAPGEFGRAAVLAPGVGAASKCCLSNSVTFVCVVRQQLTLNKNENQKSRLHMQ